jgi:hypothetical protein
MSCRVYTENTKYCELLKTNDLTSLIEILSKNKMGYICQSVFIVGVQVLLAPPVLKAQVKVM